MRKLVVSLAKEVGIKKPCTPHKFRHARLTELAKYLPEQKLKVYAGWTPGSRMTGTYVHLSGKDLDQDILQLHGITPKEPEKPLEKGALKTQQCVRCKRDNPATAQYCQCGMILDRKLAIEKINQEANIEELRRELEKTKTTVTGLQEFIDDVWSPIKAIVDLYELSQKPKDVWLKDKRKEHDKVHAEIEKYTPEEQAKAKAQAKEKFERLIQLIKNVEAQAKQNQQEA